MAIKKTIKDCITEVLESSGKPMSSKEVFEAIVSSGLYQFNTANPANVVRSQLRRHSKNIPNKNSSGGPFEITLDGKFKLVEQK